MTALNQRSIPTHYKGIRHRSRLEAKWAAFFHEMGWSYTYEPLDLYGWAPDFLLRTGDGGPFLVEVKPLEAFDPQVADKAEPGASQGPGYPILICGLGIRSVGPGWHIGWIGTRQTTQKGVKWIWDDAFITSARGIAPARFLTDLKGGLLIGDLPEQAWARATNAAQWIPVETDSKRPVTG